MKRNGGGAAEFRTWAETNLALNINFVYLCACSGAHLVLLDNHSASHQIANNFLYYKTACACVCLGVCVCYVLQLPAAACVVA